MTKKTPLERGNSRSASRSPGKEDPNSTVKTQTAFVGKLYTMVEDPTIQNLISWSNSGKTFLVHEPTEFSKKVLPIYFKHNNWQSFVRQLNMYGFHKVNNVFHSNSPIDGQPWEFEHNDFRKGAKELLGNIKRKAPKANNPGTPSAEPTTQSKPIRSITPEAVVESDPRDEVIDHLTQKVDRLERNLAEMHRSHESLLSEVGSYKSAQEKSFQLIARMADMLQSLAKDDYDDWQAYRKRKIDTISDIKYEVASLMNPEATDLPRKETTNLSMNHPGSHQNIERRHLTPPFYPPSSANYSHSSLPSIQATHSYPLSPSSNPRDGKSTSPVFLPCTNITLPPLAEMASHGNYDMNTLKRPRFA
ncbi:hypothetical protein K493DRAFT_257201 [Basidiobolus meristosporus CBS 931.73]|uniref:HSF-type DNA-binding domain-containing protein n=1 Tax=Basidiobolus meristosporus CBS 931.73 TaxID=1314790 RepID=A0A1Y1YN97_9FUNG|nr:hypothetical protein K493DRAFT_257201 [Basidiobolus meristosporus CBS 931.73]|eukprot:ORX99510.1 hypothetical protein K493DRAFT_257201 [Basidiobolus meristosporus CBS 931.73]